jgi:1-acyl-sn-glycerol-3-phosphate acyltransferase
MIYGLAWVLFRSLFRLLMSCRYIGTENVPRTGPVILASNHLSYLDPPLIGTALRRWPVYMGKAELFQKPLLGWICRQLRAFPVERGMADRAALKHSLQHLAQGGALVIFPEGTRSETGELGEPEMGLGMLAYRSGAPVVPVYLHGTDQALPRSGGLHLAKISASFGPPLIFKPTGARKPGREEYEAAARDVMAAIAALRESVAPR